MVSAALALCPSSPRTRHTRVVSPASIRLHRLAVQTAQSPAARAWDSAGTGGALGAALGRAAPPAPHLSLRVSSQAQGSWPLLACDLSPQAWGFRSAASAER